MGKYSIRIWDGKRSKNFTIYSVLPIESIFKALRGGGIKGITREEQGVPSEIKLSIILRKKNGTWCSEIKPFGGEEK